MQGRRQARRKLRVQSTSPRRRQVVAQNHRQKKKNAVMLSFSGLVGPETIGS
jgi:hypothetical protein